MRWDPRNAGKMHVTDSLWTLAPAFSAGGAFAHRENRDRTIDSICRACRMIVCTSVWEADLERAEEDHACKPRVLEATNQIAGRKCMNSPNPAKLCELSPDPV